MDVIEITFLILLFSLVFFTILGLLDPAGMGGLFLLLAGFVGVVLGLEVWTTTANVILSAIVGGGTGAFLLLLGIAVLWDG